MPVEESQRPTPGDLLLGGGLLVVAVLSGLAVDPARPDTVEPTTWWQWALIVTPALTAMVRRASPVVAAVVATAAQILIWTSGLPDFLLALVVVLYTAAADGGRLGVRVTTIAGVILTVLTSAGLELAGDVSPYQVPLVALTCATAIGLGITSARQRDRSAELAAEITEARMRAEHDRDRAIAHERSTIARELHDIIGHTLATIAVRAEAADRVSDANPQAATEALGAIADTARTSLDETRRVLAGLRDSAPAELAPAPGLAAIRSLVVDLRRAGADVTLVEAGCDDAVPPAVVLGGAYRILQESLTNAIKHGGAETTVRAELRCTPDAFHIEVVNALPPVPPAGGSTPGHGVRGMAERANVLGGTFSAERSDTAFTVTAQLPIGEPS